MRQEGGLQRCDRRAVGEALDGRTARPPTCGRRIRQAQTGSPSRSTVQAPQSPASQPTLVPVRPRSSRSSVDSRAHGAVRQRHLSPLTSSGAGRRSCRHRRPRWTRPRVRPQRPASGRPAHAQRQAGIRLNRAHRRSARVPRDKRARRRAGEAVEPAARMSSASSAASRSATGEQAPTATAASRTCRGLGGQPRRHHGDRDDEIAAGAELDERGCRRRARLGHADGGDHFVGGQRGAAVAEDEVLQRQVAHAARSASSTSASSESSAARHRRPARRCRDCRQPWRRSGSAPSRCRGSLLPAPKRGRQRCGGKSVHVVRCADHQMAGGLGDAAQGGEPVNVEDIVQERIGAQRRIEIGAAGKNAPAAFAKQGKRVVDGGGFRVTNSKVTPGSWHSDVSSEDRSYANDIREPDPGDAHFRAGLRAERG